MADEVKTKHYYDKDGKRKTYKERVNPKTGLKEYKVRYYFVADGKKKDSETAWFSTLKKAEDDAIKQKLAKEKADRHGRLQRRDKLLITVFEEYIDELKEIKDRHETTTDGKIFSVASAIKNKHMPPSIQNVKIKDLEVLTFKTWHSILNNNKEISGEYMRACREVFRRFNSWMANNNYYNDDFMEESVAIALNKCVVKKKSYNNRENKGERNLVTTLDIEKITGYYFKKGIEVFDNFYHYTLFYLLFYSGMRVEELSALQWKFIDLREEYRTISIRNAISEKENRKHALERTEAELYHTKSTTSERIIPIFDIYYGLLIDYKDSYKYEYGLNEKEMEDCFVFPRLSVRKNPKNYMYSPMVRRELQNTVRILGMKNTDLQMFRHSCATFLILPPPEGLGYTEEKVKDYFGHQDTSMLNRVYAKLTKIQKSERMRMTFSEIYKPKDIDVMNEREQAQTKMILRVMGDNDEAKIARQKRVYAQIERAIANGKKVYGYSYRDEEIIESYKNEFGNDKIEFVLVE